MDDKRINKGLRREFGGLCWVLVAYFALMNLMVILSMALDSFRLGVENALNGTYMSEEALAQLTSNGWGYIVAVLTCMVILFNWKDETFWKERVLAKGERMTAGSFAVLLCLCMAAQLLNGFWVSGLEMVMNLFDKSLLESLEALSGASDSSSMFLYASILAPITEELIFRGLIQRSLERYGRKFSIIGSAFLFGIFHGNLIQTPYAFLMGLILAYTAAEYHIGWAMGIHLFNNLLLADLLSRATALLPAGVGNAIQMILLICGAVAAVIALVLNRARIREYNSREAVDSRCLKWFFLNSGMIVLLVIMCFNAAAMLFA